MPSATAVPPEGVDNPNLRQPTEPVSPRERRGGGRGQAGRGGGERQRGAHDAGNADEVVEEH